MEGSHARLEKHLPPYLSSIYLPLALVAAAARLPTLPSSYYSSFYTLLQNAILQIEHKHIVTITFFVPHAYLLLRIRFKTVFSNIVSAQKSEQKTV